MAWGDSFTTKDPETNEDTNANVKTDDEGFVSDLIYGTERDSEGGKHGHVWGLNTDNTPENDEKIGGRDPE